MSFFSPVTTDKTRTPLSLQPQCGACGLHRSCKSPKIPVQGAGRRKILVVGEHPTKEEDNSGDLFSTAVGQHLWETLARHGVGRDDCWVTSALRCRVPAKEKFPDKAVSYCRPYLVQALTELKPEVILLLGYRAVQSCVGWLWKEDVGGRLERWVGHQAPVQSINAWVCPTWHPADLFYDGGREGKLADSKKLFFDRHVAAAAQLEGRPWSTPPDWRKRVEVVTDVHRAAAVLDEFTTAGGRIAWDIETTTLKPDGPHAEIYCCAVCWEGKRTIAYPWHGAAVEATERLLRSPVRKIGYNMTFESRWLKAKRGFWVKDWVWDGMLAAHTLDSRSGVSGLKFQAFVRLGQDVYNDRVEPYLFSKKDAGDNAPNRIREAPLHEVLLYCGMDALLEWKVAIKQARQMGVEL